MNYLVLDTSSGIKILLTAKGKNYDFVDENGKAASTVLLPEIDRLLKEAEVEICNLDAIAVVVGPGSFTGIRIAVNTARMFSYVTKIPMIRVDNLELCAFSVEGECNSVVYGWGKNFYLASFADGVSVGDARCVSDEYINGLDNVVCDGKSKRFLPNATVCGSTVDLRGCVERKLESGDFTPIEEVVPFYIAVSQAENDLAGKEGR